MWKTSGFYPLSKRFELLKIKSGRGKRLRTRQRASVTIFIRGIANSFCFQFCNNSVKHRPADFFEPFCAAKQFHQSRTDCIIEANQSLSVPSFREKAVAKTAEYPHLRTVVRTVNGSSHVTASSSVVFFHIFMAVVFAGRSGRITLYHTAFGNECAGIFLYHLMFN